VSIPAKRGRRGLTLFGCDPTGTIRTQHIGGLVDVLATGAQTVLPPSVHPDIGRPYIWVGGHSLTDIRPENLPVLRPDVADRLAAALSPWLAPAPQSTIPRVAVKRANLTDQDRRQHRHYAEAILSSELRTLGAMARNSGRNQATFRVACRLGRWVHAGIMPVDRLTAGVLEACARNGVLQEDGRRAVMATIASGLNKSAGDGLPVLGGRRHG
jgi:hypothetical protein